MGVEGVWEPALEMLRSFWQGISTLILAVLVFLLGWLVIKGLTPLLARIFKAVKIDNLVESSGFKEMLARGNITRSAAEMLARGIYWVLLLVVIFISLTVAGIAIPEAVIGELLAFIPKVILALLVVIFSFFVGRLFKGIVQTSLANTGIAKPEVMGKITETAIVVFGIVLSLQVIGIASEFVANAFNIVLAAFAFGAALAFALGAKDIARDWLTGVVSKKKE